MTAVAAWSKQQLVAAGHGGLVYVNECKPSFTKFGMIPAGLDIISFDQYELANESKFAPTTWWLQEPKENQAFAAQFIAPKMHPHQKLMVVPGFYGNDTAKTVEHAVQDGRLLAKLEAYWTWIKDDKKMVGLNPYHWVRFQSVFRRRPIRCFVASHTYSPSYLSMAQHNSNACPKPPAKCTHMCYGSVCGPDGELFGWGAKNYPRLVVRMKEIGAIIRANSL